MAWKFDPVKIDIIWTSTVEELIADASIDFGDISSDISIDTGDRTNDTGIIDQGERII